MEPVPLAIRIPAWNLLGGAALAGIGLFFSSIANLMLPVPSGQEAVSVITVIVAFAAGSGLLWRRSWAYWLALVLYGLQVVSVIGPGLAWRLWLGAIATIHWAPGVYGVTGGIGGGTVFALGTDVPNTTVFINMVAIVALAMLLVAGERYDVSPRDAARSAAT